MKKRHITLLLMIWLFSQQPFAAALIVSSTSVNCVSHAQSDCTATSTENTTKNTTAHMGHSMPMLSDSGRTTHDSLLMNCDHCATACQPSLISHHLLSLVSNGHLLFEAQPIDAIVDTFLNTLYRPPIPA